MSSPKIFLAPSSILLSLEKGKEVFCPAGKGKIKSIFLQVGRYEQSVKLLPPKIEVELDVPKNGRQTVTVSLERINIPGIKKKLFLKLVDDLWSYSTQNSMRHKEELKPTASPSIQEKVKMRSSAKLTSIVEIVKQKQQEHIPVLVDDVLSEHFTEEEEQPEKEKEDASLNPFTYNNYGPYDVTSNDANGKS